MSEADERAAEWAASYSRTDGIRSFFAPTANLATGAVVGIEVLPRPRDAAMGEVIAAAAGTERRSALDAGAAAAGIRRAADLGGLLPLHVDLLADTVAEGPDGALAELHRAVGDAGRTPAQVVVEIGPPAGDPDDEDVLAGARALRSRGYRIGIDEVGLADHPLALIARIAPDFVLLDPEVVAGLADDPGAQAVADAVARLAARAGTEVVACGVTEPAQLEALHRYGIGLGRGPLVGSPGRRPVTTLAEPLPSGPAAEPARTAATRLAQFVRPAVMAPEDATGEEVRELFTKSPELSTVVLTTGAQRPVAMLERTRFLLAVSARFGFALHAERPVRDLADPPRVLPLDADPRDAIRMLGGEGRAFDEVAVVDNYGRCRGVARIADLLQALAGMEHRRALALHPVTGLPGLPALADALAARVATGSGTGIGLVTADLLAPTLAGGFDGALDGLRRIAKAVGDTMLRFPGSTVGHGSGDDLVVLTDADSPPAFDAALRAELATGRSPAIATAWLRCGPGDPIGAAEIARALARLRERLHSGAAEVPAG